MGGPHGHSGFRIPGLWLVMIYFGKANWVTPTPKLAPSAIMVFPKSSYDTKTGVRMRATHTCGNSHSAIVAMTKSQKHDSDSLQAYPGTQTLKKSFLGKDPQLLTQLQKVALAEQLVHLWFSGYTTSFQVLNGL